MTVNADIVVIGGGPAGVTAAVTAARLGNKVALIGNRPVLGGVSSSEIRIWTRGATGGGNLYSEELGVWGDFKMRNLFTNPTNNPIYWDDILLDSVVSEPNISLYLNTNVSSIKQNDDKSITSVFGIQQMSEQHFNFEGSMFIDCTGDGIIGALAGIPFTHGKEGKEKYNEEYAPANPQKETLGSTITFYTKKLDEKVSFTPPNYAFDMDHIKKIVGQGGRVVHEEYSGSDYWWFEYGGLIDTIKDNQEIAFEVRKVIYGVWNYIKNSGNFDADYLTLEWIGSIPGKRESRRMITDYVINQNDIISQKSFEDGGFYGGWFIDFHPADGIYTNAENALQIPVNVYEMPLSTLYNSNVGNLFFAGRDIGASHSAFASSRIMNTCALSGQAAATLADRCLKDDISTKAITKLQIDATRQQLDKDDMWLLSYTHNDNADKALSAKVTVSSVHSGIKDKETSSYSLKSGGFISYPHDKKHSAQLLFNANKDMSIEIKVYATTVPSRYKYGEQLPNLNLEITKGKNWIEIPSGICNKNQLVTLEFPSTEELELITTSNELVGVMGGNKKEYTYFYPCIKLGDNSCYGEGALANSYNRLYSQPNIWVAENNINQEAVYNWENPTTINEIRLWFNPDLSKEITSSRAAKWADSHMFVARNGVPPELVKDFSVLYNDNSGWKELAVVKDNWKRMQIIKLDQPITTDKIKVVIQSTYGAEAQIFQVRMY